MNRRILLTTALLLFAWCLTYAGNSTKQNNSGSVSYVVNKTIPAPGWMDAMPGTVLPVNSGSKIKTTIATKAPFDIDLQWSVADTVNAASLTGVAFTGTEFWISRWNQDTLFTLNANGTFASRFVVPGVTGTRSLTWDGTSIYAGGAGAAIREINPSTKTLASTITLAAGNVGARMCAYDPNADNGNGGFWIGNFTSAIQLVSMTGAILTTIPQTTHGIAGIYGGAVDTFTAGGPYLLVYAQDGASQNTIHWIDLNTNTPTGVTYNVNQDVIPTGIAGGLFVADGIISGEQHILAMTQAAGNVLTGYELGLPPAPQAPANDTLCDAIEIPFAAGPTQGTNLNASVEPGEPSGSCYLTAADATVWYYFVAPSDSNYVVTTNLNVGTNNDTQLAAYLSSGGCNGTLTEIACNDDISGSNFLSEIIFAANNGDTVWLQVDGWQTVQGTFEIDVFYDAPLVAGSRDFELYNAGDLIVANDPEWAFWPGATLDAPVTTAQSQSGTKSLLIDGAPNQDLLFLLGDQTSGTWGVGFSMYIPSGNGAYYNLQETQSAGVRWPIGNVVFDPAGTGTIDVVTPSAQFTFPHDTWFDVRNYVDLDNDTFQVWIDNSLVLSGQWTGNGGTTQLGGINIYPDGAPGTNPANKVFYLDDMYFQPDSLRSPVTYSFSPFNLTAPSDGTRLEVESGNSTPVVITWGATTVTPAATPLYSWMLDVQGGNFSNPLLDFQSDNGGVDAQITLTSGAIDTELSNLGVPQGDSVDVIWTAEASVFGQSALAANGPFDIRLVRKAPSALSKNEIRNAVNYYPNPSNGQLTVNDKSNTVRSIVIQNLLGQTLKSFDKISSANQLDLSDLGEGIYLIRFVTEYGDLTDKIIIQ